ncbi:MAG: RNase P subunit p30 family protein [Candidatus Diapherotrites archaeon]
MLDLIQFSELKEIEKYSLLLGNDSVIVCTSSEKELSELNKNIRKSKFQFRSCFILRENDMKQLRKAKSKSDMVAVYGGTPEMNKFAASHKEVDLLINAVDSGKLSFDTAIARTLKDNKVCFGILFSGFLNVRGKNAALFWKNYFLAVKMLKKFRVNFCLFSGAKEKDEIRSVEDLAALAIVLGFSEKNANVAIAAAEENLFERKSTKGFRVIK